MKKILLIIITLVTLFNLSKLSASPNEAKKWLNNEINEIISLYKNDNIDNETRLKAIENAINTSFAGTGIARFVVANVWNISNEESQKKFVKLFKEHLYLTIGSLMQGYSNQNFEFVESREDKNQNVYLIDMEIEYNDQRTLVTWRVKESKNNYYVIDLLVADISLVVTKRSEFSSMLKKVNNNLAELNILLKNQNVESYDNLVN